VTAKNKPKKIGKANRSENLFSFRFEAKNSKRNEAKKLGFYFRLNKRKQSETDPVSLRSEKKF
jgi:hypothetical protein